MVNAERRVEELPWFYRWLDAIICFMVAYMVISFAVGCTFYPELLLLFLCGSLFAGCTSGALLGLVTSKRYMNGCWLRPHPRWILLLVCVSGIVLHLGFFIIYRYSNPAAAKSASSSIIEKASTE